MYKGEPKVLRKYQNKITWEWEQIFFMFQFNSKSLCLTYSNVNQQQQQLQLQALAGPFLSGQRDGSQSTLTFLDPGTATIDTTSIANFLRHKHQSFGIQYLCVSRERHKDGELHYHAAIKLREPLRTRTERFWDWNGLHPNVQSARSFPTWVRYIKKDGDYIEKGFLDSNKPTPSELIEMAKQSSKLEFISYCSINKFQYAGTIWEMAHPEQTHTITEEMVEDTIKYVNPTLLKIFLEHRWDETKVLILYGDTGMGKTSMAKIMVPKPALMVSHLDDLKKFRPGYHQGIIFDDVSIKHLPETAQIHLLDNYETRSIHVRYGTVTIPKETRKIFTCNEFPVTKIPAIERRIQHFKITNFIQ
jgi:hypothetical protein